MRRSRAPTARADRRIVERANLEHVAAHKARRAEPAQQAEVQRQNHGAGPEDGIDDNQQVDVGDRGNDAQHPHKDIVDDAAEIAGGRADDDAQDHGDCRRHDGNAQADASAVEQARQLIAPKLVSAQPVRHAARFIEQVGAVVGSEPSSHWM